jgi:hypothetical protein
MLLEIPEIAWIITCGWPKLLKKEKLVQSSSLMSTLATPCMTTPWKQNMLEDLRPGLWIQLL